MEKKTLQDLIKDLTGTVVEEDLIEKYFSNIYFEFGYINLHGADFTNVYDLGHTDFSILNFNGAGLESSDFIEADFSSSNMTAADFSSVNFTNANFDEANFIGADFGDASFVGADLENIILSKSQAKHIANRLNNCEFVG
ncbi:pentapeptide repeat-containing protein [Spiroplasma endosymbiont of Othius punctulatus]|uniref:pentapeptide repeat-containing protein n=1 Tax=Spiroplasma endosymbiont of Othius punctulatus TaxID=3066289 RepID=UPI0030D265E1